MQAYLQLGNRPAIEIEVRDDAWVEARADAAPATACESVAEAATAALESPLGLPAIGRCVVPGDHVAIAIGEGVRQPADVVRGLAAALERVEIEREAISIVVLNEALAERLTSELEGTGLSVHAHHADDEESLCFLALMDEKPLRINRHLFEADMVLPVGCARMDGARDVRGAYESVYPCFSDTETLARFEQADALDSPTANMRRRDETDRAGWLLGAPMVVQVVPGPAGSVAAVVAGAPENVTERAAELCAQHWQRKVDQPADLVVATIVGGQEEQTWKNVARALHAARRVMSDGDSAVAVCTELDELPGDALRHLIEAGGDTDRLARLGDVSGADAGAAWELYKALCRGPVFFMSRLDNETVEAMGLAPMNNDRELARLAERSRTCLVINESQHAVATLAGE